MYPSELDILVFDVRVVNRFGVFSGSSVVRFSRKKCGMVAKSAVTANETSATRIQPTWIALLGFGAVTRGTERRTQLVVLAIVAPSLHVSVPIN
jgi:hypothetical protein